MRSLKDIYVDWYVDHVMLKSEKSALEIMADAESNSFVPNRVLRVYAERFAEQYNKDKISSADYDMTATDVLWDYLAYRKAWLNVTWPIPRGL